MSETIKDIMAAIKQIKETGEKEGNIKCPKCKKQLEFKIMFNDHIWGKCTTENCLRWGM